MKNKTGKTFICCGFVANKKKWEGKFSNELIFALQ
jgi:hypothetical protein